MDIGVSTAISSDSVDVAVLAKKAESLGFESFWLPEHTIVPVHTNTKYAGTADGSIPPSMADMGDPLIGLARASAVTEKIKLGTAISLVPEHNPLIQAKQIATLDRLSNGRFIFGIGAGWLAEETEIMGGDFEHRWGQAREAILAMKELWTKDEAEIVLAFADYYRDGGRATNGWSDPVAALVSYRVVTTTGTVFAAADGAALIPPADSRLDVSVTNKSSGSTTGLTCDLTMSKNRAAVELLKTQIPAGYIIGGQSLSAGVEVGKLDIFFDVDHP